MFTITREVPSCGNEYAVWSGIKGKTGLKEALLEEVDKLIERWF
jgi:hypothetical protein